MLNYSYQLCSLVTAIFSCTFFAAFADELPTCLPKDFHYEYTQCDSDGGRWRVSVPRPNTCVGGAPNPPVRGRGCDFTCQPGEYLDVSQDQECHPCPAGHYSLGGGVRYDDWESLPKGFSVQTESFASQLILNPFFSGDFLPAGKYNCTGSGWVPRSKYLSSDIVNCTAILVYTANLVRPGIVTFTYQFEDDNTMFSFEIQNSRCETLNDRLKSRYLTHTSDGTWNTERFELKTGVNILFWRVLAPAVTLSHNLRKPVLIQSVDISGVAFTSECTSCKAGMYSSVDGSIMCKDCPSNTYSLKGASECIPCDSETAYSEPGSDSCKKKLPCTDNDYYEYQTACNSQNKTRKVYRWAEPKFCRDGVNDAAILPPDGDEEDCPPCNPGMEPTLNGSCRFCPANHFSDGSGSCQICRGSTAAEKRIHYKWWNNLPENSGISSSCLSENGQSCSTNIGWNPARDHIYSSKTQQDDAYLILSLRVSGFQGKEVYAEGRSQPVAKLSFTFDTSCAEDCSFIFMQNFEEDITLLHSFTMYEIVSTSPVTFVWAFQKRSAEATTVSADSRVLRDDVARIFVIDITNTRAGGAESCTVCPKGASQDGCIPCPEGQYIDTETSECKTCPDNTVVRGVNMWGVESCRPCGPGLTPKRGSHCVTECRYNATDGNQYDFSPLAGVQTVEGIRLFTTSGYKYYRMFQISLCSSGVSDESSYPLATCYNNATSDVQADDSSDVVQSPICRSTILPSSSDDGKQQMPLSVQPISLSDALIAVTENGDDFNITMWKTKAGFLNKASNIGFKHDTHFVYLSDQFTSACRHGRMTIITMRCDPQQSGNGTIELPSQCPDGTCDGCVYLFLWRSQFACPRCNKNNYTELIEECRNGQQKVLRIKPKDCFSDDEAETRIVRIEACSILWQPYWPIWLKAVVVLVPVIVCLGIILLGVVLHCWLKNKKLEYKYMKLVESTNTKEGELPAAETCALDEGEEDEQFDAVEFKQKGHKFFSKFKSGAKKDKSYDEFHDVSTDHSSLLG